MRKHRFIVFVLTIIMLFSFVCSCSGDNLDSSLPSSSEEKLIYPEGFNVLNPKIESVTETREIGVEFDPHFFISDEAVRQRDKYFDNIDRNEFWTVIESRIKGMGVGRFRVMVCPPWFEPENDNDDPLVADRNAFTYDSAEMKGVKSILALAKRCGVKVTLVLWGVNKRASLVANGFSGQDYFMSRGNSAGNWVVGAKGENIKEYAECFSELINYLISEQGYDCIDEITPGNEPDWSWQVDEKIGDAETYIETVKCLDERFKRDSIRDKVKFNLSDATDVNAKNWLDKVWEGIKPYADVINSHTYIFSGQSTNTQMVEWAKSFASVANEKGIPAYVGEFGSYPDGGNGQAMDSFYRALGLSRQMLNFYNGGISGMSYWNLFDHYNSVSNFEAMDKNGLWYSYKRYYGGTDYEQLVQRDFAVRKQYYMYAAMCNSIKNGSNVYPIDLSNEFVAGTLFVDAENKDCIVICNQTDKTLKYAYAVKNTKTVYEGRVFSEDTLPEDDSIINVSQSIKPKNRCISFIVPANTLIIIKQK